jgi:hypothetical protein
MTPKQWQELERIYNTALEYSPEERRSFIAKECGADTEPRRAIESLTEANAGDFLEQPAAEVAAKAMARSLFASGTGRVQVGTRLGPYEITGQLGKGGRERYIAPPTRDCIAR